MIWGYLGCWCTSKSSGAPGTWRRLLQSRYSCWQRRGTEASPEPAAAEVVLLSASMPINMLEVIKKLMRNPFQILVMKEDLALERIMVYNNFERGGGQIGRKPVAKNVEEDKRILWDTEAVEEMPMNVADL
ncbi:eukaryotic initiation factor 4A-II-like isoform X3 [Choloepus didactylus]|uniref:eukaryotic initiation factor 4A-II-like isoform X3 n=1 Tax=Choloepus didactylus TaxID=27675 RepID=UPI0018A06B9D|nr:eukaryotic initiation factor 4A-II-like isoform X3 [Choloepus didactylus]